MDKILDIEGRRFGLLEVLCYDRTVKERRYFFCLCDCGTISSIPFDSLIKSYRKSCGCLRKGAVYGTVPRNITKQQQGCDITGVSYGDLSVLYRAPYNYHKESVWVCRCNKCGRDISLRRSSIARKANCGCDPLSGKRTYYQGDVVNGCTLIREVNNKRRWGSAVREVYCPICKCYCEKSINSLITTPNIGCGCVKKHEFIKNLPVRDNLYNTQIKDTLLRKRYRSYREGGRQRNLVFLLTVGEFKLLTNSSCVYCGAEPNPYNGIDRVDNKRGYEFGNCVPCCTLCNKMKQNFLYDIFLTQIDRITKNHKNGIVMWERVATKYQESVV